MDILILNWKDTKNPEVGGAEIILYEFAKRWLKNGNKVTWFCRSFPGAKSEEFIDGIRIIRRGNKLTTYLHAFLYYRHLSKKPDIVLDVLNTIFWQTPLYIPNKQRVAYVNQLAKEVLWHELPPVIPRIFFILEKIQFITYKRTYFICYAKSTKNDLVLEGVPNSNIDVFPIGLDHSRYYPGKKSVTPLFICINRLVRMKRTSLVIQAMKIVTTKYKNAQLVIAGYGYERARLDKLRKELKLTENVFFEDENILFFKRSTKDKKVELMQKAWALVFPSVKEGWGMTVTECAACGTPAIVTDVTGLRDSVINNKTGLKLEKNPTVEELADAIIKFINNTKMREKMSKEALNFSKQFTWERAASKSLSLLRQHVYG